MATITPKELATRIGTDPKTVRKFLRSKDGMDMKVGKGQRWAIEAKQVATLKRRFAAWDARRKANQDNPTDEVEAPEVPEQGMTPDQVAALEALATALNAE